MNPQGTNPRNTIVVDVAGQKLRLAATAEPGHLERLAAMVNERVATMQRGTRTTTPSTMLALVALEMADEVLRAQRRADAAEENARQSIASMEARSREVEQAARRAVAEALLEIDRALEADAEHARVLAASETA